MPIRSGNEDIYSARETAERMGMSPNTITKWLRTGQLRGVKRGKVWYVPESAIFEYIGATDVMEAPDAKG